jgi:hypothetical protein
VTPPGPADTSPAAAGRRWSRFALISLFGIAVGALAGWVTLSATRPSENDLQRAVIDEIGLPAELEASPLLAPVIDHYTTRITDRAVRESRGSATLAIALSVVVSAAATATTATLLHPSPSETRTPTLDVAPPPPATTRL